MRKIVAIVIVLTLAAFSATAMDQAEHLEHLRMMLAAMSSHGPVIPQPETITGNAVQTINITAQQFSFSPSSFSVNQGDVVTINLSVPANDGSTVGHGIFMITYIEDGMSVGAGKTGTRTFTATTAGTFGFSCTQPSCGIGHGSMFGQMIVNAVAPAAPMISSLFPTSGPTAGGTTVIISGSNFQSGASVLFDSTSAASVNVTSSSSISAVTPAHGPGAVTVTVTNPDRQSATTTYTYPAPPLAVSDVSPTTGPIAGGTQITLTGVSFQNGATVTVGGTSATNVNVVSSTTITATTPPHAAGPVDVVVTVGSTSATKSAAFTYVGASGKRRRSARH
jgi:plastocyanin